MRGLSQRRIIGFAVLVATGFWAGVASAATLDIKAGADLATAAQEAADGDVLRLEPGRYTGPVMANGKVLTLEGSAEGEVVIAPGPSNVVLAAVNGGALELSALSVETSAESPLGLFAQGGSVSCTGCTIVGSAGSAVYVEAGTLELEGGTVTVPTGEAVLALSGSTVNLSGVTLRSAEGSPLVAQKAVSVRIVDSIFEGVGGSVVSGPTADILISSSGFTASAGDANALRVETGGELLLGETAMRGGRFGLAAVLGPGARASLRAGSATGTNGGLYLEQSEAGDAAGVAFEHFLVVATGTGDEAVALRAIGPLAVTAHQSSFLSGGIAALATTGGAWLRVDRGVLSAVTLGATTYGDAPGEVHLERTIAVPPASIQVSGVSTDTLTAKFSHVLGADATLAREFAETAVAVASQPPLPYQTCLGSCPDGWPADFAALAERVDTAAAELATVELEVVDGAGRALAVPFGVLSFDGELVAESADGKAVAVAAGAYLVESASDASLAVDIDVAAGAEGKALVEVPERLWLDINVLPDSPARLVLFEPVQPDVARAILRADDGAYAFHSRLARRATATDQDVAAALAAARQLVAMRLVFPEAGTAEEKAEFASWRNTVYPWALAVLASAGAEEDAGLIAELFDATGVRSYDRPLPHLAYLEHRLGRLHSGVLTGLATGAEAPPAARAQALLLLNYYGAAEGLEELFALFEDPLRYFALHPADRSALAARLAGSDWPDFPAAAGRLLSRAVENREAGTGGERGLIDDIAVPLAGYLAMFGTPEEKRIIADELTENLDARWVTTPWLSRFAVDTTAVAATLIEDTDNAAYSIPIICPYYRLRGEDAFHAIMENTIAAYAYHAVATKDYATPGAQAYYSADLTARAYWAACRPDPVVAKAAYTGIIDPMIHDVPGDWYLGFQSIEPLVEYMTRVGFMTNNIRATAHELVLEAWSAFTTPPWSNYKEERMALHRAFTKQGDVFSSANDQIERRLYVVRHVIPDAYSGALAGHLEVRPTAVDGKLVLDVRLNQQPYYSTRGAIADAIGTEGGNRSYWAHQPYVVDGGRKLIEKLTLRRAAQEIPLKEGPVEVDGFFRFETDLPANELANLVLNVDLALFDDRRSLEFDLFASGFARRKDLRP